MTRSMRWLAQDGAVTIAELTAALQEEELVAQLLQLYGFDATASQANKKHWVHHYIVNFDKDGDGVLSFEEFCGSFEDHRAKLKQLEAINTLAHAFESSKIKWRPMDVFNVIDKDHDG